MSSKTYLRSVVASLWLAAGLCALGAIRCATASAQGIPAGDVPGGAGPEVRDPYAADPANAACDPQDAGTFRIEVFSDGNPVESVSVQIDGQFAAENPPFAIQIPAGTHRVTVHHPWYRMVQESVSIRPQQETALRVELVADDEDPAPPHREVPDETPLPRPTMVTERDVVGPLILGATGVVALGLGITGLLADGPCNDRFADGTCRTWPRLEPTVGWIGVGAGAGAVLGAVLWHLLSAREVETAPPATPRVLLGPDFFGLEGNF